MSVGHPEVTKAVAPRTPHPTCVQLVLTLMGGGPLGHFDLDESFGALPVSEQIIAALSRNAAKVLDLFRSWDNNNDGIVTRAEFHKAMRELGLEVPKTAIDAIFSKWDDDDSGILSARGSCCTSTHAPQQMPPRVACNALC